MRCSPKLLAGTLLGVLVAVGSVSVLPISSASGQIVVRARSGGAGGGPMISTKSVDDYERLLKLTSDQVETLKTLHEGYRAAYKAADEEREAKMEAVQEKMSDGDFKATEKVIRETMDEFGTKSAALEKQFMEDFKAIATGEQTERWPAIERHRRRETRLNTPSYSGSALDLIKIVQRTKSDPGTPEFATLLEQYEMAIDRQIQENSRKSESLPAEKEGDAFDPERQDKLLTLMGENGLALRNLNRDYAARLAGLMPEEARNAFESEVAKRSFSQVYGKTHVGECLEAASGFSDLDTNQKETLAQIKQQFEREVAPLNLAWSDAVSKAEEEAGGSMQLQMKQWQGGGVDPAVKAARDARRDLEKRMRTRLDEVLTPAQEDRLPAKKKSEGQGGFGNVRINLGGHEEEEAE